MAHRISRWLTLPAAAIAVVAVVGAVAARRVGDPPTETPQVIAADRAFGQELLALRYAEVVKRHQVADAMATIDALSRWPQPAPPPAAEVVAAPLPQAAPVAAAPRVWTDAAYAAALIEGINARRAESGLPAFAHDGRLASAASAYALRLSGAGAIGHSVGGTTLLSRLQAAGMGNVAMGEVLAWGTALSPASIVQMWMDSESHRSQILSPTFAFAGSGCAFDDAGTLRCVVDFAG